ncbi:capsular exopolysaccharide family domain protein [Paraburkholderia xenovorans LB400]|jgi:tyrosine-protein kinase Etk/Wzc|uniref:Putative tyrosine-protein kinase EpsB n=1 Tax=Paraburkholderia xenovorans (strain LB400) TaxID=266265 RepID=Q144U1_PARXL|nr:polysaccharide biosynthesis tyrosine autokinase [Paraburkholderia xenovorans]ABE29148.1 Protein-tyrosine kinase [Paraburkholderia xenovorans LB400]AIP31323.1 capsular exopolysaccharide family domain protein [Paraburkholderia xenovorans LB400]
MNSSVSRTPPVMLRNNVDAFSIGELARHVVDNVWLVIGIVAVVTGAAALYAFVATPIYSADALVKVDFPQPNALGEASKAQEQVVPPTLPTEAEIQIIQSRSVIAPVISKFRQDISITPNRIPVIGALISQFAAPGTPMAAPFGLGSFAWGGEEASVGSLTVPAWLEDESLTLTVLPGGHYRLTDPKGRTLLTGAPGVPTQANGVALTMDRLIARPGTEFTLVRFSDVKAIERFQHQLKVSESGKDTGVVQIIYENPDPELARAIANGIAQGYIASHIAQHRAEALTTREFIVGELPQLHANLTQAEAELSQFRTASSSMQASTEAASYLQGSIEFDRQIAMLKVQKAGLESHFAANSRDVQAIDNQLQLLENAKSAFEARFDQLPASERRSADLTRNVKVAEDIYVAMVNKSNELAVTQAGTLGNVHIIDTALLPVDPVKPKRPLVIAVGAAGGLILAILYVFIRRLSSSALGNSIVAERHLNLPVFGHVLFSDEQARLDRVQNSNSQLAKKGLSGKVQQTVAASATGSALRLTYSGVTPQDSMLAGGRFLLATDGYDDIPLEALRGIRATLQRQIQDAANNVLVVTGATPGTGKSFISSNLAVLSAEAGKRVLLIDGDMRRGQLAAIMKQTGAGGLSEVLTGRIDVDHVIRNTDVHGLSFIAAGRYPSNPSQLLSTSRMQQLLERLGELYDVVIVDTPPVLAVSDANLIASLAGSTVLVVRPDAQSDRELEEAAQRLDRAGARLVGMIFNAMPRRRSEKRSYGYAAAYSAASVPPQQQHGAS